MQVDVTESPIFVIGAPRSGTSMMQWSLREHPELWGGPESDFIRPLVKELREVHAYGVRRERLHWLSHLGVGYEQFVGFVGIGLNAMYTDRSGGLRWVEQTPQYTLMLDEIELLFPGAKFIYMKRDGRSVVNSLRSFTVPREHEEATRIWVRYTNAAHDFLSRSGQSVLVVPFDELIGDTELWIRQIYDFLGVPNCAASVDFIADSGPINSSFEGELSKDKSGPRWLGWTAEEKDQFVLIAGEAMQRAGYGEPDLLFTAGRDDY